MGEITGIINKEEYAEGLIDIFEKIEPLFTSLEDKYEEKSSIEKSNKILSLNSIEEDIKIAKTNILNRYNRYMRETFEKNFNRIKYYIYESDIRDGKTISDLITSKLEVEFLAIKENKKLYNIVNKTFFINSDSDESKETPSIDNALENLSKKYNINILFGHYVEEKTDVKMSGHFVIKKEDAISLSIDKMIISKDSDISNLCIVNNIQREASRLFKMQNAVVVAKILFAESIERSSIGRMSYINHSRGVKGHVLEVKI
jgi:hypothetical protein